MIQEGTGTASLGFAQSLTIQGLHGAADIHFAPPHRLQLGTDHDKLTVNG